MYCRYMAACIVLGYGHIDFGRHGGSENDGKICVGWLDGHATQETEQTVSMNILIDPYRYYWWFIFDTL